METFIEKILTEYGGFVAFLVVNNFLLGAAIRVLWKQVQAQSKEMLETIKEHTRITQKLVDRLEDEKHD